MTVRTANSNTVTIAANPHNLAAFLAGQMAPWATVFIGFVIVPALLGKERLTPEHVAAFGLICIVSTMAAMFTAVVIHDAMPRRLLYPGWRRSRLAFVFGAIVGFIDITISMRLGESAAGPLKGSVLLAGSAALATAIVLIIFCRGIKRGCCPRCDYDLRASFVFGRCPECGLGISRAKEPSIRDQDAVWL